MATNLNVLKVNNEQAHDLVKSCILAQQPVLVHGAPGIGKSQMFKQIAEEMGIDLMDLRLAQFPPEDLAGVPVPVPVEVSGTKIDKNGNEKKVTKTVYKTKRSLPDFLPRKGKGLLVLDEINQANASVLNAVFQLILDRQMAGGAYVLPEGWTIVAACNDLQYNSDVTEFNSPINDRFIHIEMTPDKKAWLSWAKKNDIHERVINFIDVMPNNFLCDIDNMNENIVFSSPRSWEKVSIFEKQFDNKQINIKTLTLLVSGIIGDTMSKAYIEGTKDSRYTNLSDKLGFNTKPYEDFLYGKNDDVDDSKFDTALDNLSHLKNLVEVRTNSTKMEKDSKNNKHSFLMITKYAVEKCNYKTEQFESLLQIISGKEWTDLTTIQNNYPDTWKYLVENIINSGKV